MNAIEFKSTTDKLVHETQLSAAKGILGCRVYEKVLDRNTLYFLALSVLASAVSVSVSVMVPAMISIPIAIPIVMGIGALGLLAYTVFRIVERSYFYKASVQLQPIFEDILKGEIQNNNSQLYTYCLKALSDPYFAPYLSVDTLNSMTQTRKKDALELFKFNFNLIQSLNYLGLQPELYQSIKTWIENEGITTRGARMYEALKLLDYVKNNPSSKIVFPTQNTAQIPKMLWDDFIHYLCSYSNSERLRLSGVNVKQINTFISSLKKAFPTIECKQNFAACKTLEDFYQVAKN